MTTDSDAKREIDRLVGSFYALFSNGGGTVPRLERIFDLFVPRGIVSRCVDVAPEVSTLQEFIQPRQLLLTGGRLVDFREAETGERTLVAGHIAQRVSTYEKDGVLDGVRFSSRGVKVFQFVETTDGWRIVSVAWDDEREGFAVDGSIMHGE